MSVVIFCIPVLFAVFLLLFFKKKVVWWEYLVLIVPSLLVSLFVQLCMKSFNCNDIEYLGYYVTKVTHYDRWNEYVHKRCKRTVTVGRDSRGNKITREEEYDCSYVKDHPERWTYTLNDESETGMSRKEFEALRNRFGVQETFRDMNRRYHTLDGDAHDYFWNGDPDRLEGVTHEHLYENRLQSSRSIFKFTKISSREAGRLGLHDYPEVVDGKQTAVVGIELPRSQTSPVDNINALYGLTSQIRMYMLFYKGGTPDITESQRSYWQGGNKNEVVLCLGYDSITNKVTWCEGFSWADVPLIENRAKQYFLEHPEIDLKKFAEYITPYVTLDWQRKSFSDFGYINVELSMTQYIIIFVITVLYNVLVSIWIVRNDYKY